MLCSGVVICFLDYSLKVLPALFSQQTRALDFHFYLIMGAVTLWTLL